MSSTVSMKLRDLMVKRVFQADLAGDPPTQLFVCLTYDVAPSNSVGLMLSEPLLGSYARVAYSLGSTHWAASGFGEVLNTDVVLFPVATMDWGLLQGWALTDSDGVGSGSTWATGSLLTPTYVSQNDQPALAPRTIAIGIMD